MKGMAMLEFSLCLLSFTVLLESSTHSPVAKKRLEISKRLSENKSKKDRQYNGQKKRKMVYKKLHNKLKIEQHESHQ